MYCLYYSSAFSCALIYVTLAYRILIRILTSLYCYCSTNLASKRNIVLFTPPHISMTGIL